MSDRDEKQEPKSVRGIAISREKKSEMVYIIMMVKK